VVREGAACKLGSPQTKVGYMTNIPIWVPYALHTKSVSTIYTTGMLAPDTTRHQHLIPDLQGSINLVEFLPHCTNSTLTLICEPSMCIWILGLLQLGVVTNTGTIPTLQMKYQACPQVRGSGTPPQHGASVHVHN